MKNNCSLNIVGSEDNTYINPVLTQFIGKLAKDLIDDKRIPHNRPSSRLTKKELLNLDKVILNKIIRLIGIREIYAETHRHSTYIYQLKKMFKLTDPTTNFTWNVKDKFYNNYDQNISPLAQKIIKGTLLGDGSITLRNTGKKKREVDVIRYRDAIYTIKGIQKKAYEMNWRELKRILVNYPPLK